MIIPVVESGLERFVRAALPLDHAVGSVSFDPPSGTWSAQVSRLTVNLFLFAVARSGLEARPVPDRINGDGRRERRMPAPIVELAYLVSAYAGSVGDEHALLSDVLTCFAITPVLPAEYLPDPPAGPVHLALGEAETRAKDVWSGVGGSLRASFRLQVTTPVDGLAWEQRARPVERIEALSRVVDGRDRSLGRV